MRQGAQGVDSTPPPTRSLIPWLSLPLVILMSGAGLALSDLYEPGPGWIWAIFLFVSVLCFWDAHVLWLRNGENPLGRIFKSVMFLGFPAAMLYLFIKATTICTFPGPEWFALDSARLQAQVTVQRLQLIYSEMGVLKPEILAQIQADADHMRTGRDFRAVRLFQVSSDGTILMVAGIGSNWNQMEVRFETGPDRYNLPDIKPKCTGSGPKVERWCRMIEGVRR